MNAQNAPADAQGQLNLADIGAVLVEIQAQSQRINLAVMEWWIVTTVACDKREWIENNSRKIEKC